MQTFHVYATPLVHAARMQGGMGGLSDLLAAERVLTARGRGRSPPPTSDPTLDELRALHDSLVASKAAVEDWEARCAIRQPSFAMTKSSSSTALLLQHGRAHHPHLISQHGTAVRLSQEAAHSRQTRHPSPRSTPVEREGWAISPRERMTSRHVASLRSSGTASYKVSTVRAAPSGFRQALKRCHAVGGRCSAASIPTSQTSQAALSHMHKLAETRVPEYQMLLPDQYHAARQLQHANRAVEADQLIRATEEAARLSAKGQASPATSNAKGSGRRSPGRAAQRPVSSHGALQSRFPRPPWLDGSTTEGFGLFAQPGRPPWNRISHSASAGALAARSDGGIQPCYQPVYPLEGSPVSARPHTPPQLSGVGCANIGYAHFASSAGAELDADEPGSLAPPRQRSASMLRSGGGGSERAVVAMHGADVHQRRRGTPPRMARDVHIGEREGGRSARAQAAATAATHSGSNASADEEEPLVPVGGGQLTRSCESVQSSQSSLSGSPRRGKSSPSHSPIASRLNSSPVSQLASRPASRTSSHPRPGAHSACHRSTRTHEVPPQTRCHTPLTAPRVAAGACGVGSVGGVSCMSRSASCGSCGLLVGTRPCTPASAGTLARSAHTAPNTRAPRPAQCGGQACAAGGVSAPSIPSRPDTAPLLIMTSGGAHAP